MIKVLNSELEDTWGGIESFLINVNCNINSDNIQFDYFMRGNNEKIEKKINGQIFKVPNNYFQYMTYVKSILLNKKYDIIHIHKNSAANIVLPILVKRYSKNSHIIIHSHNTQASSPNIIKHLLHYMNRTFLNWLADSRFACSEVAAEWLFGKKSIEGNPIYYVKNGISIKNYIYDSSVRKRIRQQLSLDENIFLIGNVGRLYKQKNQIFLIDILAEAKKVFSGSKLILCGDGDLKNDLMQRALDLNVLDDVLFMGECRNVNEILQAMDVFVMPSLYEGLTIAAIEAQCAGLPCVFSDTLSKETMLTHQCVTLSLKEDSSVWAEALLHFLHYKRVDLSENIRSGGFDIQYTVKFLENYYISICE